MNQIEIGHGLVLKFTWQVGDAVPSDVWVQFYGEDGKSAAISIAAQAERSGSITGAAMRSWASDRINEYIGAGRQPAPEGE